MLPNSSILVQARTGSTRLPNKTVLPFFNDKTILEIIILNLLKYFRHSQIVIATTINKIDDQLASVADHLKVNCYRGDEQNVLKRFIESSEYFGVKNIVRVCADNPFLQAQYVKVLVEEFEQIVDSTDYLSFSFPDGTPVIKSHLGLFAEATTLEALKRVEVLTSDKFYFEHVTNYMYSHPEHFRVKFLDLPLELQYRSDIRLTIDTIADFNNARTVFENNCKDPSYEISIPTILNYLDHNQHLLKSMTNEINRTQNNETYIIGEIGQNHNGSVDLAKILVDFVSVPIVETDFNLQLKGMNAVKLTKRDLKEELTESQMNRPYDSPHSFGKTYGEHRAFLELNDEQHFEIYTHTKSKGLDFVETLCSRGCLSLLKLFTPDFLKVASRDLTNLPLLEVMAETKIPMILSTGMAGKKELDEALAVITKYHQSVSILHCVSQYPTEPKNTNLNSIKYLQTHYPNYQIGYSDHTIGISTPVAAVAMGARIIEKHITIDRRMKGTDQSGSLAPDGINRMVRDIRLLNMAMGKDELFIDPSVAGAKEKLERSIATKREIAKGEFITENDLHLLSPGDGYKWSQLQEVIGKAAKVKIPKNEIIYPSMV